MILPQVIYRSIFNVRVCACIRVRILLMLKYDLISSRFNSYHVCASTSASYCNSIGLIYYLSSNKPNGLHTELYLCELSQDCRWAT